MKTEFADVLPPLSTDEFAALRASIKDRGVLNPVFKDEDGNVLDGRHRLEIDPKAPVKIIKGLSPAEKQAFVFQCNFSRRNLSPEQKREALGKMKTVAKALREEDPKKNTQKRIGMLLGVDQATVSRWLEPTTNMQSHNGSKPRPPKPDSRVKVTPEGKAKAVAAVQAGTPQAQVAADLGVSQQTVSKIMAVETKKAEAEAKRAEDAAKVSVDDETHNVFHADFREGCLAVPDSSVALIFTDPPYDRESLPLFDAIAETANRVLVDGASLITFCGQYVMFDVMARLSARLRYFWICCCQHTGNVAEMREYGIKVLWKPMLWFVKGDFRRDRQTWVEDLVVSQKEKSHHTWQQSLVEAKHFIEALTVKGETVLDPCCGGGTTALSAKELGRKWLTFDTDLKAVATTRKRLAE